MSAKEGAIIVHVAEGDGSGLGAAGIGWVVVKGG